MNKSVTHTPGAPIPMLAALRKELSLLKHVVWRTFWRAFVVIGAVLLVAFEFMIFKGGVEGALDATVAFVVALGFAVAYALVMALAVTAVVAGWHLFGASVALPIVLLPFFLWVSFWIGGDLVRSLVLDLWHALAQSAGAAWERGDFDLLGAAPHAGPLVLLLIVVQLPLVLLNMLSVVFGPSVLVPMVKLLLWIALLVAVAAVLTVLVSLPVLGWSLVRRVRARQRA